MAPLYSGKSTGAAGLPGRPCPLVGPSLALAGILALARIGGALAGALALAGVDAAALHAIGVRRGGESAGRKDRDGRGDDGALGHDVLPQDVASQIDAAGRPCTRSTSM